MTELVRIDNQQAHVLPWFANKQEAEDELARWAVEKGLTNQDKT